jgi:hypothetical protein
VHSAVVYIDHTTDVRNLYVAMTRGTHTNEAFIAVRGEERARDVFERCAATDWIDRPAHIRQAELAGLPLHRPGLLDGEELRELMGRKHQIDLTISIAEMNLRSARRDTELAQHAKGSAAQQIHELRAERHAPVQVLEKYDRPGHRRRHEPEITQARRQLEMIEWRRAGHQEAFAQAEARLAQAAQAQDAAQATLAQRPRLESELRDINATLTDDTRVRTQIARHEQPAVVIDRLGERPPPGPEALAWDKAAGQLMQRDAAFPNDRDGRERDEWLREDVRRNVEQTVTKYLDLTRDHSREMDGPDIG